jgi:hypothetical protein
MRRFRAGAGFADTRAVGGDRAGHRRVDKKRLSARAGQIAFELTNDRPKGHNVRIHTGDRCCFRPGSKDVGGTRTISTGRARVVLDLKPGTYTYLCSTGGYWRTQHGTLVVR